MKQRLVVLALGWAIPAAAQFVPKSDWEEAQEQRDWRESDVKPPAWPKREALIEFFVSGASSFRFFVDPASLSVAADGVVRYTLVARSGSGVENVSYEGIRCAAGMYKVFAFGNDGQWRPIQSDWKLIEPRAVQRWHNVLRSDIFCPHRQPIRSTAEGVDALRRGVHPLVKDGPR